MNTMNPRHMINSFENKEKISKLFNIHETLEKIEYKDKNTKKTVVIETYPTIETIIPRGFNLMIVSNDNNQKSTDTSFNVSDLEIFAESFASALKNRYGKVYHMKSLEYLGYDGMLYIGTERTLNTIKHLIKINLENGTYYNTSGKIGYKEWLNNTYASHARNNNHNNYGMFRGTHDYSGRNGLTVDLELPTKSTRAIDAMILYLFYVKLNSFKSSETLKIAKTLVKSLNGRTPDNYHEYEFIHYYAGDRYKGYLRDRMKQLSLNTITYFTSIGHVVKDSKEFDLMARIAYIHEKRNGRIGNKKVSEVLPTKISTDKIKQLLNDYNNNPTFDIFRKGLDLGSTKTQKHILGLTVKDFQHVLYFGDKNYFANKEAAYIQMNRMDQLIESKGIVSKVDKNELSKEIVKNINAYIEKYDVAIPKTSFKKNYFEYSVERNMEKDNDAGYLYLKEFSETIEDYERYDYERLRAIFNIFIGYTTWVKPYTAAPNILYRFRENNVPVEAAVMIFEHFVNKDDFHLTASEWDKVMNDYEDYVGVPMEWVKTLLR